MLRKLIKHEFKNTYKVMLLILGILTVITLLGMMVLTFCDITNADTPAALSILAIVFFLFYLLSIFAFFIMTYVYLGMHFYKTMYSAQGYLTHTLPVKPLTTLHVKLGVSVFWLVISNLLAYVSFFGLLYSLFNPRYRNYLFSNIAFSEIEALFLSMYDMNLWEFALFAALSMVLSCLLMFTLIALSCSIGQLFHSHKGAASLIAGILLYFIQQALISIYSISRLFTKSFSETAFASQHGITLTTAGYYGSTLWISLFINAVFVIAYYIACNIIVRKHINLE